jgi:hypothetical protein
MKKDVLILCIVLLFFAPIIVVSQEFFWEEIGTFSGPYTTTGIATLEVVDGELYALGSFEEYEGTENLRVAKWNGSTFGQLGSIENGFVRTLAIINNKLYAAGAFNQAEGSYVYPLVTLQNDEWVDDVNWGTIQPASILDVQVAYGAAWIGTTDHIIRFDGGSIEYYPEEILSCINLGTEYFQLGLYQDQLFWAHSGGATYWDGTFEEGFSCLGVEGLGGLDFNVSQDGLTEVEVVGDYVFYGGEFNLINYFVNGQGQTELCSNVAWRKPSGVWESLGLGVTGGAITEIIGYGDDVFIFGKFDQIVDGPSTSGAVIWRNNALELMENSPSIGGYVTSAVEFEGNLYVSVAVGNYDCIIKKLTMGTPTEEILTDFGIEVAPTITNQVVSISSLPSSETIIEVVATNGEVVRRLKTAYESNVDVDISALSSGIYFLRFTNQKRTHVFKILKTQ